MIFELLNKFDIQVSEIENAIKANNIAEVSNLDDGLKILWEKILQSDPRTAEDASKLAEFLLDQMIATSESSEIQRAIKTRMMHLIEISQGVS